jgi:BirA family biotin operon repressor/biotin-[acetyl-CoA-carboxylase] ligase
MNYKLISFDRIPSTQSHAQDLVRAGAAADRTIILADSQSAGRGRYRRTWVSRRGNLYASFIYKSMRRDPRLSYAVAVAVAETFVSFGLAPSIKWPNDILIGGRKISGILIEYAKDFVIVGIGANIKTSPRLEAYRTAKVADYAPDVSRDELLASLARQMDFWMSREFSDVKNRWTGLAANLNKTITYRGRDAVMCGLNDEGALVLRRGREYIMAYGDEINV